MHSLQRRSITWSLFLTIMPRKWNPPPWSYSWIQARHNTTVAIQYNQEGIMSYTHTLMCHTPTSTQDTNIHTHTHTISTHKHTKAFAINQRFYWQIAGHGRGLDQADDERGSTTNKTLSDINWGAFNHAFHAPQLLSGNYISIHTHDLYIHGQCVFVCVCAHVCVIHTCAHTYTLCECMSHECVCMCELRLYGQSTSCQPMKPTSKQLRTPRSALSLVSACSPHHCDEADVQPVLDIPIE